MEITGYGEQAGIALELVTEQEQGSQTFLGLADKGVVGLETLEAQGVVDVVDGNGMLLKLFAEKDVLIAVVPETLVERMSEHQLAGNEEIGGVEVVIGRLPATLGGVLRGGSILVHGPEIARLHGGNGESAVEKASRSGKGGRCVEIVVEVAGVGEDHVAIDEQQPGIAGLGGKEIADGGAADILCPLDIPTVGQLVDGTVGVLHGSIGRTVVGYENLIVNGQGRCLSLQAGNQAGTVVIIGRNKYRKFCHWVQK